MRQSLRALALPLVFGALAAGAAQAADWPRFRGPNGTGVAADKNVPVRWTDKDVAWKAPIPGTGHSSPIVAAGHVYLQSATAKERLLLCLDAASGKVLWTRAAPGGAGKTHAKNSLASSTPAADADKVYAIFWDGKKVTLHAYDHQGKPAWQYELGEYKQVPGENRHGAAYSPVAHGGKVFVNFDQTAAAAVVAVDAKTGKKAWQAKRKAFRTCYSTPFVLDGNLLVVSTQGVTAYKPDNGDVVWDYPWSFSGSPLRTVGSPVAADGVVFAASGDGSGARHMIALKAGGKGELPAKALLWEKTKKVYSPYVPSPLVHDRHVYFVDDSGFATCLEAKTGKEKWRARTSGGRSNVSASPVLVDGKVYAITEGGDVFVFEASPEKYKLVGKSSVGESVLSSPAVADGRLYVRGERHLFCVGKPAK